MEFRPLKANEIDCRIASISEKGLSLLLYKDARVDMRLLDETVGSLNWKRSHQMIENYLCCTVDVWDDEKSQWISKQDVGSENYSEPQKSIFSDSFKRACFNFGIGRELYTAPFIWIGAGDCNIKEVKGKYVCYDRFTVSAIEIEAGTITMLEIVNEKTGKVVFQLKDPGIDALKYKLLTQKCKEKGESVENILNGRKPSEMSVREWTMHMKRLEG